MSAKPLYPRADVNPKEKQGRNWLLQYAKAAWKDSETMPDTIFYRAATKYQELRDLALGKQDVEKYKPLLGVDSASDETWLNIDWSTRPIHTKFRDIAISKILQREFKISATPIDAKAKGEMDKYFADQRVKITMRKVAMQSGDPELMNHPMLQPQPGDPEDLEELEMKLKYGIKLDVAIEAEKGIELIFDQNDMTDLRKRVVEDLFDYGVGGYKEFMNPDGTVGVRDVRPEGLITSFSRKFDFTDLLHIGEVIEVPLVELSKYFSDVEMEEISQKAGGRSGAPEYFTANTQYNQGYDGFKVQVLDLELISDDTIVFERRLDSRGNLRTSKGLFEKRNKQTVIELQDGQKLKKFIPRTITNIYKIKWVVGTDYCYDFGLAHDMKREPEKKFVGRTSLSYHLYAWNFNNMRAQSMMERLRPSIDDYHLTHYKLQNLKNRMIPNGWAIDLDALESVDLAKSGENMTPQEVLSLLFHTGILIYRGSTLDNTNVNRKPVEPIQNSSTAEFAGLVAELERIKQEMRDMTGLNEVTDGSTPSDRMLNGVASLAATSTNNALYPLVVADKRLLERTGKGVIQRLQIAVKNGNIEGVVKGLGDGTARFMKVTNAIAPHVWGIMIQDLPTEEERQMLLQQLNLKDAQGQIDPEDVVVVYNIHNIKEARQYLAYKVSKRRKEAEAAAQQGQQQLIEGQIKSVQAAEEEKRKTEMFKHKLELERITLEKQWDYKIKELELSVRHETTLVSHAMNNDSRERMAGIPDQPDLPLDNGAVDEGQQAMPQEMMQGAQPMQREEGEEMGEPAAENTPQEEMGEGEMAEGEQQPPME